MSDTTLDLLVINTTGTRLDNSVYKNYNCKVLEVMPAPDVMAIVNEWYEHSDSTDSDVLKQMITPFVRVISATKVTSYAFIANAAYQRIGSSMGLLVSDILNKVMNNEVITLVVIDRKRVIEDRYYLHTLRNLMSASRCLFVDAGDVGNYTDLEDVIAGQIEKDSKIIKKLDDDDDLDIGVTTLEVKTKQ